MVLVEGILGNAYHGTEPKELPMDAMSEISLFFDKARVALGPVFTQGVVAIEPLIRSAPWPFLCGAFLLGLVIFTLFRALTSIVAKIIMLPVMAVTGYLIYISASSVFKLVVPLLQHKFPKWMFLF